MDLNIFNQEDKSGNLKKEKYLIKNYPEEYLYILDWNNLYNLNGLEFKLKVYHCINDLKYIPKCDCGKDVKFKNSAIGYNTYCSIKCQSKDNNIKEKRRQTNIKRYGTDKPQQLDSIKEKTKETNRARYGVDYGILNDDIKNKAINTLQSNYGVDNPNKSPIILEKRIESFKKSNYKENYKKTCLEKYGVDHVWSDKSIHDKAIQKITKNKHKNIERDIINYCNIQNHQLINIDWNLKNINAICDKNHIYEITNYLFHLRKNTNLNTCTICNKSNQYSGQEINLIKFIEDNYNDKIIINNRSIINPYELDIYLPELNLAFEFNGLYWHSELYKDKNYHLNKTKLCEQKNIQLIHIYEDDWLYKQEIVKSIILNKLGKSNKIYARKCIIKEVNSKDKTIFLDNNHIQGNCISTYNFGLYYNDELVSIMTFGNRKISGKLQFELLRFCNKIDTTVIGGASKLFKHFINNYQYSEIISYADKSRSNGNLYKDLGFNCVYDTVPNYYWIVDDVKSNRFNWQKHKLIKMGYDKNKTAVEIMHELGYYRIFNSGSMVFKYV